MKGEYLRVAEHLLNKYQKPMNAKELIDLAYEEKLFSDKLAGKTPRKTMEAALSRHIRKKGGDSLFIRTGAGQFFLPHLLTQSQAIYEAPRYNPSLSQERVLVFPSSWLDINDRFQGIQRVWRRIANRILSSPLCRYMDRLQAEQINNHKQILTYIIVTRRDQVLAYKRGTFNRVEDYLRGAHCIGFGGHVAETDGTLFNIDDLGIKDNAIRELSEELKLPPEDKVRLQQYEGLEIIGVLNDDSSAVGRRHFAFILKYEVSDSLKWEKPERGEKSITQLRWLNLKSSDFTIRDFEYWSQLCLRTYFADFIRTQPSYIIRRKKSLQPPHLLCVLGGIGSGKSEATHVLREEFGYTEINSGQVMAGLLGIAPVPSTERQDFQKAAWRFISKPNGPRKLAAAIWEQVKAQSSSRILVDGLRQRSTLEALTHFAADRRIGLLYVYTPPDIAYQFYKNRREGNCTIHDFLNECDSPVEAEIRNMIGISDAVLYNWTGRPLYHDAIGKLMENIGIERDWEQIYGWRI